MVDLSLMTARDMGKLFDYAVLPKNTTEQDIRAGCREAIGYNCKAFCFSSSYWTPIVAEELAGTDLLIGAAIAFPFGQQSAAVKLHETEEAVRMGATTLDCCMNIGALKDKKYSEILDEFIGFKNAAGSVETKMIIEVAMLTREEAATACKLVAEAGIDWVKSSSGQYDGPTLQDVMLMAETVRGTQTRVKVSGVKAPRPQNAFAFILAGAELIGTQGAKEILDSAADLRAIGLIPAYRS